MRISVALLGLVWPLLTASTVLGQDKPIANAVRLAKSQQANKATTAPELFALNGIEKANPTALSPNQVIHKLTLKPDALASIWREQREFLEISIPTANGTVDLELIPSNIFAPGFKVTTATHDSTATVDINKTHYYHGILKDNPNSVVSLAISEDDITAMIFDSTGNRVLAHKRDKAAPPTEYALYDEKAVMTETKAFGCGVVDGGASNSIAVNELITKDANVKSSCPRFVGIYIETDYGLYQYHSNNLTALRNYIGILFNQVAAIYRNESIEIRLTQIGSWTSVDPYTESSVFGRLAQFERYWQSRNNGFSGQLAHLINGGSPDYTAGGVASSFNGLFDKSTAYSFTDLNSSKTVNTYPAYSRSVVVVAHELGHNIGSPHTHSCSWLGGPIDNCAPQEGTCSPGLRPATGGGTIMSYCDQDNTSPGISLQNGFGTQPGNLIRNSVAQAYLPTNGSVQSGDWTSSTTWACGQMPSVIDDVLINASHAVQLNTSGNAKSLNIEGTLNLNTTNSSININNN